MTDKLIDLHLHLDGAVTPEIAKRLAEVQGMTLPAQDDAELKRLLTVPPDCESLNDFLACFALPVSLMQTAEGLSEAAFLVAEEERKNGVIYAEIRFAPQLHGEKGLTQREAICAVLKGLKRSPLKTNLILCLMRGRDNDDLNRETLEMAREFLVPDGGVTAIDLAGAEGLFPTADYAEIFAQAKAYGVPFTLHAGEADGAESVRLAVEYGAVRIGHGVRISEDGNVRRLVREKGIVLEMCPTSNRQTKAVPDMRRYPLRQFLAEGIAVTVNTDDPAIEGTDPAAEFRYLQKAFGLTGEEKRTLLLNAADAAFTTDEVKAELRRQILGTEADRKKS